MSRFYGYEKSIAGTLREMGYDICYLDYFGPVKYSHANAILGNTISKTLFERRIIRKLKKLPLEKFDYLLVIRGTTLTEAHLDYIASRNPDMTKILYQWDAISQYDYLPIVSKFDRVFTFEKNDAKRYGFIHLPLFCDIKSPPDSGRNENIDLLLIGTYQEGRYREALRLYKLSEKYNLIFKCRIYIPFTTFLRQLTRGHFVSLNICKFTSIGRKALTELYVRGRVFVDVIPPSQKGLSMRSIECYGMNKKLITSNYEAFKDYELLDDMEVYPLDIEDEKLKEICRSTPSEYRHKSSFSLAYFLKRLLD